MNAFELMLREQNLQYRVEFAEKLAATRLGFEARISVPCGDC